MAENFFVTAVIVSHDGATWLTEGIAALFSQTRPVDRIIAIDTDSHDNSVKLLTNAGIKVFQAPRETGFGDAIDIALETTPAIAEKESELLWILHDDCAPTRNALEKLIEALADKPQVAIVGPKLRGWYDRHHLLEVGVSIAGNGARGGGGGGGGGGRRRPRREGGSRGAGRGSGGWPGAARSGAGDFRGASC